ncbi:MAG: hypothetical protein PSX36_01925 [bacterium]|nr:hypothetical protein [bacterium]
MTRRIPYPVLFSFLFLWACTKDVGQVNRGEYPNEVGKIITGSCSVQGCHNSASYLAASGLNLETWESLFAGSSSGSPVIPFSSRFSSLCYFINTYSELGSQNNPTMPLNKSALSYDNVKIIKDWVDMGAPDRSGKIKWAGDPLQKKLYAVNQGCDVVTVFDAATQLPMRSIEVGKGNTTPHQLRVSPDGKYWYVVFINNNVMKKFRCSDDAFIGDIPLTPFAAGTGTLNAQDWNTFTITKDGKRAYCVSWTQSGKVAKVDLEHMKFLGILSGLYNPHGIALNNNEDLLYVAAQTGNYLTEIDTGFSMQTDYVLENASQSQLSSLDPHDLVLSGGKDSLFITCQTSNEVRIFDLSSKKTVKVIKTGFHPQEIVYSSNFKSYYVSYTGDGSAANNGGVSVIPLVSLAPTNILCGAQAHGLAVDESKGLLYLLSRNVASVGPPPHHSSQCNGRNGFVNFINLYSLSITKKKYELSVDPYFIAARP